MSLLNWISENPIMTVFLVFAVSATLSNIAEAIFSR